MIYEATLNDLYQINNIYNQSLKAFYEIYSEEEKLFYKDSSYKDEGLFKNKNRKIFCYKDGKNVLGFTTLHQKNTDVMLVNSLYVDPICQNQGIGKELLRAVEVFSFDKEMVLVAMETHVKADWAILFYEKNGYEIINDKIDQSPYNRILDKPAIEGRPIFAKIVGNYKND
jgi:ribosomal protein S18 acetylase RimI-like enzyme